MAEYARSKGMSQDTIQTEWGVFKNYKAARRLAEWLPEWQRWVDGSRHVRGAGTPAGRRGPKLHEVALAKLDPIDAKIIDALDKGSSTETVQRLFEVDEDRVVAAAERWNFEIEDGGIRRDWIASKYNNGAFQALVESGYQCWADGVGPTEPQGPPPPLAPAPEPTREEARAAMMRSPSDYQSAAYNLIGWPEGTSEAVKQIVRLKMTTSMAASRLHDVFTRDEMAAASEIVVKAKDRRYAPEAQI